MSLANENDMIIPGTTGLITALGREANAQKTNNLAQYISEVPNVYSVIVGRAAGIPLENLVSPSRISSSKDRIDEAKVKKPETHGRVYEDWFRE